MAEAIIWRISDLLDDLPKYGKSWAVGGELHRLKKTVSALQSVVRDAEKRLLDDFMDQQFMVVQTPGGIREWFDDLKAAVYDAEDLLEEWSIEVTRRELPGKDEKLEQDVQVESGSRRRRERSDSFGYEEEIIGRDGAKSAILKFLLGSDAEEKILVVSICGVGGVGKTALARCLYKDDMVNKHFDLRIWVCVRHLCDLKMALQKITESATNEGVDDIELEQLQNRVVELVRGRKYLLVVDDVMSHLHEQWGRLKSLLMGGVEGSKILITTRVQSVAHSMGTTPSYFLEALSENSSLDLLMRMACEEEEETRDSIKLTIGRRIVKKCGGIPLAIRTIGSILLLMKRAAEWLHFEHEIPEVSADFYGIIAHLKFSYEHLPSHLKQCFVFCSLFPEDSVIDKLMLTSLWMAEGFIRPIDNVDWDMEDIAHDYFMDLLRRNFFRDCIEDEFGNVTACKMHGILNTLARIVAENEYSQGIDRTWSSNVGRIRHVSWGSTLDLKRGLPSTLLRAKHLRTFIKTDQMETSRCETQMGEKTLCDFISSFKFLRALDWHDSGIEKLPSSICELRHLTFLDLSENDGIIRLPNSMTRLHRLQISFCPGMIPVPRIAVAWGVEQVKQVERKPSN
ncbi:putative disease resistance protein RGA1 [Syzygium oleosum]|uniref:putative disease resistance protein RGA1 n=1 Tax=Syzygium oleosum TaxID=219896 RepID=UPI0024B92FB5|nr:putative disease resistance protein RGA1 [Syzygium oleosum]